MPSIFDDPEAYAFSDDKEEDLRRKLTNQQAFNAMLQGVGDLPYSLLGAPVEIGTGLLRSMGMAQGEQVGGIDYIKRKATELGIRPPDSTDPTMRDMRMGAEIVSGGIDPTRVARVGGVAATAAARKAAPMVGNAIENYMAKSGLAPRIVPEGGLLGSTPQAPVSSAGFYSAAEQAALNLPRNKGTGQALLNDLMKGADVKKDELQSMGLLESFANRPQATKQDLIDYVQANKVDVRQTVKTSRNPYPYQTAEEWQSAIFAAEKDQNWDLANELETAWNQFEGQVKSQKIPRYESYTLPGGKNYREVLLTLPTKRELPSGYKVMQNPSTAPNAQKYIVVDKSGERYGSGNTESDALNKYFEYHTPDAYKSSHWDEPNVMAHLRLNDRVDVDGKKMTMIEEVQSDWHQAGREKGYGTKLKERYSFNELPDGRVQLLDNGQLTSTSNDMKGALREAKAVDGYDYGVPDAPMKDTWYQTALRKAVKDAIDSGSDRVGIPTGGRQAERFGKGKRVVGLDIDAPEIDGMRGAQIRTDGGNYINIELDANGIITKGESGLASEFVGKKLEEMIGKEGATKALSVGDKAAGIKLDNVVVGGKGMKKYYDDIYPKYLDKFAKKYGSKVSDGSIDVSGKFEPIRYIDITPEMRKALGGKDKGVPLFGAGAGALGLLATDEELKKDMQSLLGYPQ